MIYEALLVPHEDPTSLHEIKRALLAYDKVVLMDPSDRELIPPQSFMAAISGMPLFGMNTGPVRPLGKTLGHDDRFERVVDSCRSAIAQGLVVVRSSYEQASEQEVSIGAVQTGGYPLHTGMVLNLYRGLASSQDVLAAALASDLDRLRDELVISDGIACAGGGDNQINNIAALPLATAYANDADAVQLTQIARGRIGAVVKYAGYCEAKDLVPVFSSSAYARVLSAVLSSAGKAFDEDFVAEEIQASRVLELCHAEYLDDSFLKSLTLDEVIRLRTTAWGKQAEAREELFESVAKISKESARSADFEKHASSAISKYKSASDELVRQREKMKFQLKCDLGATALSSAVGFKGALSLLESPSASVATTLALATAWLLGKARNYVPDAKDYFRKSEAAKRGAAFGIHDFYSRVR